MPCPSGMILRKGYTRKGYTRKGYTRNIHVKRGCIKAQSQSGLKRSTIDRAKIKKLQKIHNTMRKKFGTPSCKGLIREGYIRKSVTSKGIRRIEVAPGCIKTRKTRKGTQLFILEKGTLSQYGYHTTLRKKDRHSALLKALQHIKPLSVYRKLMALYVLNKNKPLGVLYKNDATWVKTTPAYMTR